MIDLDNNSLVQSALAAVTAVLGIVWRQHVKHDVAKEKRLKVVEDATVLLRIDLAKIGEQIMRYTSDIESEKRTRSNANLEINRKLDRLIEGRYRRQERTDDC